MKKITLLLFTLLISSVSFSQDYYGIYVEDTNYGGPTSINNGFLRNVTETLISTSSGSEGTNHRRLDITSVANTNSETFVMAQYDWAAVNLSAYSSGYFNISMKTNFPDAFYVRFQSGANRIRVTLNPSTGTYGLNNDEKWYTLSIPFSDFEVFGGTAAADAFTAVDRPFIIRSISDPDLTQGYYIEYDGVFLSKSEVLSVDKLEKENVSLYPNPAENNFNIKTINAIDNLSVFNVLGQKVFTVSPKTNSYNVDMSSFKSGIYLVKITSEGKELTSKLIKK